MVKIFKCLPLLGLGLMAVGCQDYDAGVTEADIKAQKYAREFEKAFGKIDPEQDWNFAQQITASMDLPNLSGVAVAKVYEVDPLATVGAKYLADVDVVDGKATWKFDAPKTDKELFVQVKQNGVRLYAGYCTLEGNQLTIIQNSFHKMTTNADTRALGAGLGDELWSELCFEPTENSDAVIFNDNYYQNHVEQLKIGSDGFLYFSSDITTTPFRKLAYNNDAKDGYFLENNRDIFYDDDSSTPAITGFAGMNFIEFVGGKYQFKSTVTYAHKAHIAHAYAISANTETVNTKWLIGDCEDLFWTGDAPFAEGVDYRNSKHIELYEANGTSLTEIEKGVIFTTSKEDAEIDIPMMYGATDKHNILGYYYYTTGQDPRDVNRYVLYDDARPSTNISVDDVPVTGMQLQQKDSNWKSESIVSCKTHRLMYFGPNGESAGTTKFPKDVKIGFFIRRHADTYTTGRTSLPGEGGWAFSDPTLNYQHIYDAKGPNLTAQGTNWTYRGSRNVSGIDSNTGKGNVKAICWNYGGRILVGFGDDTGDCDLNDFVFWVNGDVIDPSKVKIGVKDEEDIYEWMVACEDLGSTDDYDFNDVVFGVKHYTRVSNILEAYYDNKTGEYISTVPTVIEKDHYLVVTPYAAGGSLKSNVYYGDSDLGEIHSLIRHDQASTYASMASGSMPILNADAGKPQYVGTPIVISLGDDEDTHPFSISSSNMGGFKVMTSQTDGDKEGETIKAPKTGEAPQMMVLPTGWNWPSERNHITNVYPKFKNWANDKEENGWIEDPIGDYVQNPYQSASAGGNDSGSGSGSGQTPSKISWPITIEGPNELIKEARATATYIVTIDGVDDLSVLTCGVDDGNWDISVSNSGGTITLKQGDNPSLGATKFWVSYPVEDDTHKTTKLYFNLSLVRKTAVFNVAIGTEPITKNCTYTTTVGTNGLSFSFSGSDWNQYGFYFTIEEGGESVISLNSGANAYNSTITVGEIGEAKVHIKRDADETWNAIDIPFTFKVIAAGAPGGNGGDESGNTENPETPEDYAQYGTEVHLSDNWVSKEQLIAIKETGSIAVTVVGKGTQWQTGSIYLYWNEPRPDWGEGQTQETEITHVTSDQYQAVDQATTLTATLTADQYATLLSYSGGLKISTSNISSCKFFVK